MDRENEADLIQLRGGFLSFIPADRNIFMFFRATVFFSVFILSLTESTAYLSLMLSILSTFVNYYVCKILHYLNLMPNNPSSRIYLKPRCRSCDRGKFFSSIYSPRFKQISRIIPVVLRTGRGDVAESTPFKRVSVSWILRAPQKHPRVSPATKKQPRKIRNG